MTRRSFAIVCAVLAIGCGGGEDPAPAAAPAAPAATPAAAAGPAAAPPPAAAKKAEAKPAASGIPEITDPPPGEHIIIKGTVEGVSRGQARFSRKDGGKYVPIHLTAVKDGAFESPAPSAAPFDVYVSVVSVPEGADLTGDFEYGVSAKPVKLAGKDVSVTVKMGGTSDWTKKASPAVNTVVQLDALVRGEEPPDEPGK